MAEEVTLINSSVVLAYGSNSAQTTANTDYVFKWGSNGTSPVTHMLVQNNTGAAVLLELDAVTSAGSYSLATGNTIFFDNIVSYALHIQTATAQNVNGTTGGNVVVRGWY
jgi:hypothetical protein